MGRLNLVVGGTGGLGSALVRRLAGEDLRVLVRDADEFGAMHPDSKAEVVEGDLSEKEDVDRAIDGAGVVFHCASCNYFHWGDLIGHTRRLIAAAEEEEERVDIVYPGGVLVFGKPAVDRVKEDQPHAPVASKGAIQENIERCLREANTRGECRTAVVRFTDLYGPRVVCRAAERAFAPAVKGRVARWPGYIDKPREFVYVDDAAEAMVMVSKSDRSWGEKWHVPGPATTTAKEFVTMAFEEAGAEPRVEEMGQIGHYMRGWFNTETKQERELFYLFDSPIVLDGAKFARAFGRVPTTPYRDGIRPTVAWWREHLAKG